MGQIIATRGWFLAVRPPSCRMKLDARQKEAIPFNLPLKSLLDLDPPAADRKVKIETKEITSLHLTTRNHSYPSFCCCTVGGYSIIKAYTLRQITLPII